jgi:UDP-N-acetylmuramate dehydrogenase
MDNVVLELERTGTLFQNEPMARHTTFGVGGLADLYLKVTSRGALLEAVRTAARSSLPCFILGSGSNILVGDDGLRGLVLANSSQETRWPEPDSRGRTRLSAESGVSFAALARRVCRSGYWGLEWAIGIPGTLGGAVVYNAGAYGGCLADVLISVDVSDTSGNVETLPAEALSLEYRGSLFTRGLFKDRAILSVELQVRKGQPAEIQQRVSELDTKRKAAQPPGRNAGSIFKNPEGKPAWWYIDQVGLRGTRVGGAEISPKHANFFMNVGEARAGEVKSLMDEAARRVRERFSIELYPEVSLVGEGFGPLGAPS